MTISIQTLRDVFNLDPQDCVIRFSLGMKLVEEDGSASALEEACEHLCFVKAHDRQNAAALLVLAKVYEKLGENAKALMEIDEAIARIESSDEIDGTDLMPELEALKESLT